ncbi:DsbA family oxidoreductase [Nocardiopsis sp. ATB16-24]|uniref:DsbA family oxidoreductase n=1 Tax=Nocardiopsis sp. ATB16-24 TaxID=3019555 RepID=UPI002552CCC1|nr:DsbA family oxidoreductase [Nocardiopsis sp. ATB16-24]
MQVQVWSDVVCPWCYIGKRRWDRAVKEWSGGEEVGVLWRAFQLDPSFPVGEGRPVLEALAHKMGATVEQARAMTDQVARVAAREGLEYDFEGGVMVNTFDVHRVLRLAREQGVADRAQEGFMRAQLVEARDLGDADTVVEVAVGAGLEAERVREVLGGEEYAEQVRQDIDLARRWGATGVPFFVIDGSVGLSGAQPVEVMVSALDKAFGARRG